MRNFLFMTTSSCLPLARAAHARRSRRDGARQRQRLPVCHSAKEKSWARPTAWWSEKYSDDKDAVASLVQSIQRGSKGKWGRTSMPPHDTMSQADLKTLAEWVMSMKP
ncbi:MAG: cytochrome C [Burkholderiaceae bacterium]